MRCSACGQWGVVTTYIEPMYTDETEYSLYIKKAAAWYGVLCKSFVSILMEWAFWKMSGGFMTEGE